MLMFIIVSSSSKIDSGVELAHLMVRRMFQSIVLCVCMGFRRKGLCSDCLGVYWRLAFIRSFMVCDIGTVATDGCQPGCIQKLLVVGLGLESHQD